MCADASRPLEFDEEVLRQIIHATPAGVGIFDARLRYVYVNPALARMNGVPVSGHIGRRIPEVLPGIDGLEDMLREVLDDGRPREVTSSGQTWVASGLERRYWHGGYHRLIGRDGQVLGIVGIMLEVSASRRQQHELERARERLALLAAAATRIGTTLDVDTTCAELTDFLVPALADLASVEVFPPGRGDGIRPPPHGVLRLRRAAMSAVPGMAEQMRVLGTPGDYIDYPASSAIPRCLESGQPLVVDLLAHEYQGLTDPNAERFAVLRTVGLHSGLTVPMSARGHYIGTVSLLRAGNSPSFTSEDVVAAQDLAERAAITLDNARRYTREHGIAVELQRALLSEPSTPHPDVEVASRYLPAGMSAMVGGDWFDTVQLPGGRTLLAMGDVMGHGVEAAVDMSHYRAMLRVVAAEDMPPDALLGRLDTLVCDSPSGRPATCLLAEADPARGLCTYASAGHLPPAMLLPNGRIELVPVPTGPPLGAGLGGYEPMTRGCLPGQVLLMYTDGLVERRGEDIDESLARLLALRLPTGAGLEDLLDKVLARLCTPPAKDDVAILAARLTLHAPAPAA